MPRYLECVRVTLPDGPLLAERRRAHRLLDDTPADLRSWDPNRFTAAIRNDGATIALLDWVRRCHARHPNSIALAVAHANALRTLRFPWLALLMCERGLLAARPSGRAPLPLLLETAQSCAEGGCPTLARTFLSRIVGARSREIVALEAEIDAQRAAPRSNRILRFPGPGPVAEPAAFPDDPMDQLALWAEAIVSGNGFLASRLRAFARRTNAPNWASVVTDDTKLELPRGLATELVWDLRAPAARHLSSGGERGGCRAGQIRHASPA